MYITQVSLYLIDDIVMCKAFPTILKGAALECFTCLPLNSIDYYDTLTTSFVTQFATSQHHHLTSQALLNVRHDKWESLRTFIDRFIKVALKIKKLESWGGFTLHDHNIEAITFYRQFVHDTTHKYG